MRGFVVRSVFRVFFELVEGMGGVVWVFSFISLVFIVVVLIA